MVDIPRIQNPWKRRAMTVFIVVGLPILIPYAILHDCWPVICEVLASIKDLPQAIKECWVGKPALRGMGGER